MCAACCPTVKSLVEGSRLLALHAATLIDVAHHAEDAAERERADTTVSFLTPISKACQTEWGIENTYNALQCFGGHGYIREPAWSSWPAMPASPRCMKAPPASGRWT
ncbi:acyl-CoA dehydrogenase family protein [Azotobacter sp. CWF10]